MNNNTNLPTDIFNMVQLGYMVFESNKLEEWYQFLANGIGLHTAAMESDLLAFRMDHHARRLIIRQGESEDVSAFGWHVQDDAAMKVILNRLQNHKIVVVKATNEEASSRGVESYYRIRGPKDITFEFFTQPLLDNSPLNIKCSGFVTGDGGMGHAAIISRYPEATLRFFEDVLNARISDRISQKIAGVMLDFTFLRFNERHHTIAVASSRGVRLDPVRTRIQHMNLLLNELDDLSMVYARLKKLGFKMSREIGQHPNDKDVSFYVISPSGVEFEIGWNPILVNEDNWQIKDYDAISLWGHKSPKSGLIHFAMENGPNLAQGLKSLLKTEYTPLN